MSVEEHIKKAQPGLLEDLKRLIGQPSVSATGEGIRECAALVRDTMRGSGIGTELLNLEGAPPLVYGSVDSKSNPDVTLLFYNHYDVQPPEPLDQWRHPPFEGVVEDGKIFGRGSSDDKGELITRIKAVESHLAACGDVPCNVRFVVEGEEEIGSVNMARYLREYRDKFRCDGVIWEFGYVDTHGRPIISLGMKGLLYVELRCRKLAMDAHSSLATILPSPTWRLVHALGGMRGQDGRVLIPGWENDARPLSETDIRVLDESSFDGDDYKREFGADELLTGDDDMRAKTALAAGTTCNIAGITSGYGGPGTKTILPSSATAKVDFRLVPDMMPAGQLAKLQSHLEANGFSDIEVEDMGSVAPYRADPSHRFVGIVSDAARRSFGDAALSVSSAGTGPMYEFATALDAPCVSVGSTYIFSRIHSPNEFARLDLLEKSTMCMSRIMDNLGSGGPAGAGE